MAVPFSASTVALGAVHREQVDQQKQPWSSAGARRALRSAACHVYCRSRCSVTCPFMPQSLPTSVCLVSVFLMEYIVFHSADVPEFMPSHHVPGPGVQPSAKAPMRQCAVGQCRYHGRECREGDAGLAGLGIRQGCLCRTVICRTSAAGTREQQMQGPRGQSTVPGPRGWLRGRSQDAAGGLAELLTPVQSRAELCAQGREELTCPVWTAVGSGEAGGPVWKLPWTGCR